MSADVGVRTTSAVRTILAPTSTRTRLASTQSGTKNKNDWKGLSGLWRAIARSTESTERTYDNRGRLAGILRRIQVSVSAPAVHHLASPNDDVCVEDDAKSQKDQFLSQTTTRAALLNVNVATDATNGPRVEGSLPKRLQPNQSQRTGSPTYSTPPSINASSVMRSM